MTVCSSVSLQANVNNMVGVSRKNQKMDLLPT